ncbi:MAG: hypothetical protein M3Z92_11080, partial [Bacteroidota bacterium]|nr:hypothetical protein [Bacteroidota bacterium]
MRKINSGIPFLSLSFFIVLNCFPVRMYAQEIPLEPVPPVVEQQLENLTESNDDQETEDDSY